MNTSEQNPGGMSDLHLAAADAAIQEVKVLLDANADVNEKNNANETPLFSCLKCNISDTPEIKATREQIFGLLWDKSSEQLMHQDNEGNTVLQLMAVDDYHNLIRTCLNQAPQLSGMHARFQNGVYPIHNAILNNAYASAQALFESDNNTSQYLDDQAQSPLHYAARYGTLEMVQLCCKHQKDEINAYDKEEKTALNWAKDSGADDAIINYLVQQGAEENDDANLYGTVSGMF
ncbi:MAG: ankyrin repeat domain-containing protein [Legionellaceae bacterium]|nr:ankyrin repeat domain-containing protein [Legionellaceae bacterium]